MAILHHIWFSFGNSLDVRMAKNTYGQPEVFRGIAKPEDGSALTIDATARMRERPHKYAYGQWFVWIYFPRRHHPLISGQTERVQGLGCATKHAKPGGEGLNGPVKALLRGHVADDEGVRRLFQLPCTIVPGLGGNLFSVKQAARNGVVSIFGMTNPRLEN